MIHKETKWKGVRICMSMERTIQLINYKKCVCLCLCIIVLIIINYSAIWYYWFTLIIIIITFTYVLLNLILFTLSSKRLGSCSSIYMYKYIYIDIYNFPLFCDTLKQRKIIPRRKMYSYWIYDSKIHENRWI